MHTHTYACVVLAPALPGGLASRSFGILPCLAPDVATLGRSRYIQTTDSVSNDARTTLSLELAGMCRWCVQEALYMLTMAKEPGLRTDARKQVVMDMNYKDQFGDACRPAP